MSSQSGHGNACEQLFLHVASQASSCCEGGLLGVAWYAKQVLPLNRNEDVHSQRAAKE